MRYKMRRTFQVRRIEGIYALQQPDLTVIP